MILKNGIATAARPLQLNIDLDAQLRAPAEQVYTAILGGGGSAKQIILRLLDKMHGNLPAETPLAIFDTDPSPAGLPPECFFPLTLPNASELLRNRRIWPSIDRSVANGYASGEIVFGSKMRRLNTTLALLYYRKHIRQILYKNVVRRLLSRARQQGGRCRLDVWYVSSLHGGAGSAMALFLAAQLEDLLKGIHLSIPMTFTWHGLCSTCHHDVLPLELLQQRADINMVSALAEFILTYKDPSKVPAACYGVRPSDKPPIRTLFLYDRTNENGVLVPTDEIYSMVANVLRVQLSEALSDPLEGANANVANDAGWGPQDTAFAPYASGAAYRLEFQEEELRYFTVLQAAADLVKSGLVAHRLVGAERDRAAAQRCQAAGLPTLPNRLAAEIKADLPRMQLSSRTEELRAAPETFRLARRQFDQRLPAVERRAAEQVEPEAERIDGKLHEFHAEDCARPSKVSMHDAALLLDHINDYLNASAAKAQAELGAIDLPALTEAFERRLAELEQMIDRGWLWLFRWRVLKKCRTVDGALADYARGQLKSLRLRALGDILGRLKPVVQGLRDRARGAAEAGRGAVPVLEQHARQVLERIGVQGTFVASAVDRPFAEQFARSFSAENGAGLLDQLLGPHLANIRTARDLAGFLNGPCAAALDRAVLARLAPFDLTGDAQLDNTVHWLRSVLDRAAPQFAFQPALVGEEVETSASTILAVGAQRGADRLRQAFPNLHARIVETGNPREVILYCERRLVPPRAAFNNLGDAVQLWKKALAEADKNPSANPISLAAFDRDELTRLIDEELAGVNVPAHMEGKP